MDVGHMIKHLNIKRMSPPCNRSKQGTFVDVHMLYSVQCTYMYHGFTSTRCQIKPTLLHQLPIFCHKPRISGASTLHLISQDSRIFLSDSFVQSHL